MEQNEKKRANDAQKLVETITFRTTFDKKMRLIREAMEKGKALGTYCEDVISNSEATPTTNAISESNNGQLDKLTEMIEELLERNSLLQEQLKKLTEPNTLIPVATKSEQEKNVHTPTEIVETSLPVEIKNQESIIEKIVAIIPEKEREKFLKEFKKMSTYRIKKGIDKNEEDTIKNCIKYCYNWGAFFAA